MEMLQAQFADKHYHIIGLQETRVRAEIKVDQKDYLVFGAPATAGGHYGCQIWLSTTIGTDGACLRKQHCKIVAKDPRFLIIQIKAPFLRTLVISAHAPTSQASLETVTKWWETLDAHVPPKLRQWPQLLLVDANARIGSQPSPAVGLHQADEQDAGGEEFHGYLLSHQLWVPATFASHHEGDAGTWKHPRTDEWSRGDYVCLPRHWTLQECRSFIEKEVDISLTKEDHRPPAVAIAWTAAVPPERHQPRRSARYDVAALRYDPVGEDSAAIINSLQQDLRSVPWGFDVHTHTEILQQSLQQWMTKWYSQRRKHPRRPHMSSATWDLVMEKQQIRKDLFKSTAAGKHRLLRACFNCWARREVEDYRESFSEACLVALNIKSFQSLGRRVTMALRHDDRNCFAALAQQVGDSDTPGKCNQIWQSIRWMLPKAKGRRGNNPLLMETLDSQWIPHFAKLEAGVPTTATTLVEQCTARQQAGEKLDLPQLSDLPTRFEIEQILLRLQANKAPGPDGIPGDLYRAAAPILAEPLHDIICKTVCWNTEAVQNKGGVMYPIHKKGSQQSAENYRGIMLLNVGSKILHSWVRSRLIDRLDQIRPDTQIGGFRNQQVTYGSHCVQLVAKLAHQRQVPMSCIFLDVQGAYHFLIRDLVMGASPMEDVDRILQNLQEWNIDQRGVKQWMKLPGILERMRFPAALVKLLREIHRDSLIKSWKLQSGMWWKYFRKVHRTSLLQEAIAADARYWHGQVIKVLVGAGETIENLQIAGTQAQGHHCQCGRSFDTIQGLTAHRRLRHNYVAPEASMVGDAVSCPHCLKYLWTPSRVKQHLSYIPRGGGGNPCYNALLRAGYKVGLEENENTAVAYGPTRGINRMRYKLRDLGYSPGTF